MKNSVMKFEPIQRTAERICNVRNAVSTMPDGEFLKPVLQREDIGANFVTGSNNYVWWWAIGDIERPQTIAEIGVRFGYSLWAMAAHAYAFATTLPELWCFDNESDAYPTLDRFVDRFDSLGYPRERIHINRVNTQSLTTLGIPPVDLVSVDGLHSDAGVYHDLGLAMTAVRPGGLVVVDDCLPGEVRVGCERYCKERQIPFAYLPSFRGIYIIRKPM